MQGASALGRQLKQLEQQIVDNNQKIENLEFVLLYSQQYQCPCCNKSLVLQDGKLIEATDEVLQKLNDIQGIDKSVSLNTLYQHNDSLNQQIGNIQAQLSGIDEARAELDKNVIPLTTSQDMVDELERLSRHIVTTRGEIERLQHLQRQASMATGGQQQANAQAEQITAKAMQHHKAVEMWMSLADLLSPSGDIGKLQAQSVSEFNGYLSNVSDAIGWQPIRFDYDNGLLFDNRPYHLLSESEQWRVDTAVSYAFARLSNMRIFAIDRFDVLDLPSRLPVMKWLHGIAELGTVDTVIMAGTMKEMPKAPPTFNVFWLGGE